MYGKSSSNETLLAHKEQAPLATTVLVPLCVQYPVPSSSGLRVVQSVSRNPILNSVWPWSNIRSTVSETTIVNDRKAGFDSARRKEETGYTVRRIAASWPTGLGLGRTIAYAGYYGHSARAKLIPLP